MAQESVSFLISAIDGVSQVVNRIHANLNQRFGGMVQSVAKFQQSMQKAANLSMAAQGVQDFGNRVMSAVQGPVEKAMEFESAMADVRKVVNFPTPEGFVEFGKQLQDLSANKIPITADGLANIAAAGGQLGIAQKDLLGFTQIAAKMSVAYDMMAADAGDNMAKLMNIFELPLSGVERLGDAINHLSDSTAAKARDIVNAMSRIGGMAKQFGLAETQAAALADAFIALGKPPEVAATAINAMLNKLQNSDKQNDKFIKALEDMGYSAKEMKANIKEDAQGALFDFLKTLENYDKETRAGFLVDLFGLEYSDDISLLAGSLGNYSKALAVLGEQTGVEDMLRRVWELPIEEKIAKLQELGLDVDTATSVAGMKNLAQAVAVVSKEMDYAGSMQREFENRSKTTQNNLQLFKNKVGQLGITIGSILLPAINNLTDKFGVIVMGITAWADAHPALTSFIVQTVAAVGALSIALAVLMKGTAAVIAGTAALRLGFAGIVSAAGYVGRALQVVGLFGSVAGMKIMNFARMVPIFFGALANPAFLAAFLAIGVPIIAVVTAIATAAFLIYQNWQTVTSFLSGVFTGLSTAMQPFMDTLKQIWEVSKLGEVFSLLGNAISQLIGWFSQLLSPVQSTTQELDAANNAGQNVGMMIGSVLGVALEGLAVGLRLVAELIGVVITALTSIGTFLGETAAAIVVFGSDFAGAFTSIADSAKAMADSIIGHVTGIIERIAEAIGKLQELHGKAAQGVSKSAEGFASFFGIQTIDEKVASQLGNQLPKRARGGNVTGGEAYMIGEQGPEIFVPGQSGTIIPNNRIAPAKPEAAPSIMARGFESVKPILLPVIAALAGLTMPQMAPATGLPEHAPGRGMITPPFVAQQEYAPQLGALERENTFGEVGSKFTQFVEIIQTATQSPGLQTFGTVIQQFGQLAGMPQVAQVAQVGGMAQALNTVINSPTRQNIGGLTQQIGGMTGNSTIANVGGMITPPFVAQQEYAPQRGATAFPRGAWERENTFGEVGSKFTQFVETIQTATQSPGLQTFGTVIQQFGQLAGMPQVAQVGNMAQTFSTVISNPSLQNIGGLTQQIGGMTGNSTIANVGGAISNAYSNMAMNLPTFNGSPLFTSTSSVNAPGGMQSIANSISNVFGSFGGFFAEGGNVSGGTPIVVGERGPEVFVPGQSGSIIPNNAFASPAGGGVTNNSSGGQSFGDININVSVQGGGNEFDAYGLAQRIRDELRLALDEANRRAMYDIS